MRRTSSDWSVHLLVISVSTVTFGLWSWFAGPSFAQSGGCTNGGNCETCETYQCGSWEYWVYDHICAGEYCTGCDCTSVPVSGGVDCDCEN